MQKYFKCFREGEIFLSLFHVSGNFKRKFFEIIFGMTKIDRHFLLPNVVICFTLYTREIARNHLSYFVACKCVIYFRVTYLPVTPKSVPSVNFKYSFYSQISTFFKPICFGTVTAALDPVRVMKGF